MQELFGTELAKSQPGGEDVTVRALGVLVSREFVPACGAAITAGSCWRSSLQQFGAECGICYAYRLDGRIPDKACDNPQCLQLYHPVCLYEVCMLLAVVGGLLELSYVLLLPGLSGYVACGLVIRALILCLENARTAVR